MACARVRLCVCSVYAGGIDKILRREEMNRSRQTRSRARCVTPPRRFSVSGAKTTGLGLRASTTEAPPRWRVITSYKHTLCSELKLQISTKFFHIDNNGNNNNNGRNRINERRRRSIGAYIECCEIRARRVLHTVRVINCIRQRLRIARISETAVLHAYKRFDTFLSSSCCPVCIHTVRRYTLLGFRLKFLEKQKPDIHRTTGSLSSSDKY